MSQNFTDCKTDPKIRAVAIKQVLRCLTKYHGEVIAKGQHPIHNAVVALELLYRVNIRPDHPQKAKLWSEGCLPWFRFLSASRSPDRKSSLNYYSGGESNSDHIESLYAKFVQALFDELIRLQGDNP